MTEIIGKMEDAKQTENEPESKGRYTCSSNNIGKQDETGGCFCSKKRELLSLKNITHIVYLCQLLSCFLGITAIAGVVINYSKRSEVKDTWLESHFLWQLKTFWIGLTVTIIGSVLTSVFVGFLILAANLVWVMHRVIKGWLLLRNGRPIPEGAALI